MRKKVKKLVLAKETVLHLQQPQMKLAKGGYPQEGDSFTNCMAISCIGIICWETDAPCPEQMTISA